MDWQIALIASAVVFAAFMVFKVRPAMTPGARVSAALLDEAKRRVEAAKDEPARAIALADAGDACAKLGRINGAVGFYHRALRVAAGAGATAVVERAGAALTRRPTALEGLMWRQLAAHPWTGDHRAPAVAALRVLAAVYARRHRHQSRRQAIEHALSSLGESVGEAGAQKSR